MHNPAIGGSASAAVLALGGRAKEFRCRSSKAAAKQSVLMTLRIKYQIKTSAEQIEVNGVKTIIRFDGTAGNAKLSD